MKKLIKKILRESDFDWAKDVEYLPVEKYFINNFDSSTPRKPHPNVTLFDDEDGVTKFMIHGTDLGNFFYYSKNFGRELRSNFGIRYNEQKKMISDILQRNYNMEDFIVEVRDI